VLPSKVVLVLREGDQLHVSSGGGGGYGDPLERDPALVLDDVLGQKVSRTAAGDDYGVVVDEVLTREQMADEFLLMGLRLAEGIDPARYARLAGRPLDPRRIAILHEEGAVETTADGMLRVTLAGFPILDAVVADLAA